MLNKDKKASMALWRFDDLDSVTAHNERGLKERAVLSRLVGWQPHEEKSTDPDTSCHALEKRAVVGTAKAEK